MFVPDPYIRVRTHIEHDDVFGARQTYLAQIFLHMRRFGEDNIVDCGELYGHALDGYGVAPWFTRTQCELDLTRR